MSGSHFTRRGVLKTGAAGTVALAAPTIFTSQAWAQDYCNAPTGSSVQEVLDNEDLMHKYLAI